jgi:alpha-1,2-mannosyltransferase
MRAPKAEDLLEPRAGWTAWAVFFAVIVVILVARPGARHVSRVYDEASTAWWHSDEGIYGGGGQGFLYLPAFNVLYAPFTWGPPLVGDVLWRLAGLLVFATGLRRLAKAVRPEPDGFALATFLSLGATWAATRTGQANLPLAGVLLHVAVDLAGERWGRVAWLLALALVLKPISIAVILVVAVVWPRTAGRLALACAAAFAVAFLHPDPGYVLHMHGEAWRKIVTAGDPGERPYEDLIGLLRKAGFDLPEAARLPLLAIASFGALALSWFARRRLGARDGAFYALALLATWLMLFNPRTETNSYVILVPYVAVAAATAALALRRRGEAVFLGLLALALGCDAYGTPLHLATVHWAKALFGLVFLVWLLLRLLLIRTAGRSFPPT